MNSETPSPDQSKADDLFIDAALREHSRLGSSQADESLIQRILVETVDRVPSTDSITALSSQKRDESRRNWFLGTAAVAAIAAVSLVVLQSFTVSPAERTQDEVHFVVTVVNPEASRPEGNDITSEATPRLAPNPYEGENEIAISFQSPVSTDPASLSFPQYSLATTFGPSLDALPTAAYRHESFVISADEERSGSDRLEYRGNVTISHESFEIEASEAVVAKAGTTPSEDSPRASLTASKVKVTQESTGRVVVASSLAFDPVSGALHLSGVKRLVSGSDELTHFLPGDHVILQRDSYTVENAPVVKYANPAPLRPKN